MTTTCTLEVAGREPVVFDCGPELTVLDAAAKAGWELPHSCRRGSCESCRVPVLAGEVSPPAVNGTALMCMSRACGSIRIAPHRVEAVHQTARKRVRARLYRVRMAAPDVAVIDLRFPAGVKVPFKAGQYLQVLIEGEAPRSFSMANAPRSADSVQLHVRVMPGSLFGERILPQLQPGDPVELELPFGDFYLRPGPAPVLLVAGGTGFAPMQSLLEDALAKQRDRSFTLYWGARDVEGFYAIEQVNKWTQKYPNFKFVGAISSGGEVPDGMRRGNVHEAVLADHTTLGEHQVYVCGSPPLVNAAREAFSTRNLPKANFFADSFIPGG